MQRLSLARLRALSWKLGLAIVCLYGIQAFCHRSTDGFTLNAISSSRPYNPAFDTRALKTEEKEELAIAFEQPYRYIGCGGQSFIFLSQDEKYVIKFFKQRVFTVPLWIRYFPIPYVLDRYRAKKTWHRQDKIQRDFASYKIAFEELQEETGVLFIHLNPTQDLQKKLTLIDKLKIRHTIDLDKMDFIVQRKADLVFDRINALMKNGNLSEAKRHIDAIVELILNRCDKGYHDRDPNIRTNCGFLGEKAIKIDVGRLMKKEDSRTANSKWRELQRITGPFETWLQDSYPELGAYLSEKLKALRSDLNIEETSL